MQYIDKTSKELGKIHLAFIICFKKETNAQILYTFKKYICENYAQALLNTKNNYKLQHYNLNQNILLQFYEHHISIQDVKKYNLQAPALPSLWTSLTKQGLIMNKENNFSPKSISYSFRYDQIIKCNGYHPQLLKSHLEAKMQSYFKNDSCCVSYVVDSLTYCNGNMFCSKKTEKWRCNSEIQIFKATVYTECMQAHIEELSKLVEKYKGNLLNVKGMNFLQKVKHLYTLKEISNVNFTEELNKQGYLYKLAKPIIEGAKKYQTDFMQLISPHCSINKNNKKSVKSTAISKNIF